MPTLVAMLAASLVGWLVEGPVRLVFGSAFSMGASLLVSTVVFYLAKRFVSNLRGGS